MSDQICFRTYKYDSSIISHIYMYYDFDHQDLFDLNYVFIFCFKF